MRIRGGGIHREPKPNKDFLNSMYPPCFAMPSCRCCLPVLSIVTSGSICVPSAGCPQAERTHHENQVRICYRNRRGRSRRRCRKLHRRPKPKLVYVKPKMGINRFGNESVTYEGIGEQKKWIRLESYGPKFVENIVQATARDILAEAMLRLENAGHRIVMHIHDEVVIEAPPDTELDDICAVMDKTPSWAKGLLLRADGYETEFYKKD